MNRNNFHLIKSRLNVNEIVSAIINKAEKPKEKFYIPIFLGFIVLLLGVIGYIIMDVISLIVRT